MNKPPDCSPLPEQETPAEKRLREAFSQMSTEQLKAAWQKGITLAALSLAQQES